MAEKNNDDNPFSYNNFNSERSSKKVKEGDNEILENSDVCYPNDGELDDRHSCHAFESTCKKEENPFSFKRFLNLDTSNRHQNLRRKTYSSVGMMSHNQNLTSDNHNHIMNQMSNGSKIINTNEMTSVLPDFVQDHLVIEQCYLNRSSSINIDNLNIQNLPDLNLEHRQLGFSVNKDGHKDDLNHHSLNAVGVNLPDFTLSDGQYSLQKNVDKFCNNEVLPDFTVNASDGVSRTLNNNDDETFLINSIDCSTRRKVITRNTEISEDGLTNKYKARISSSPSVPLDLPSYEGADVPPIASDSLKQPIPFDLTVAAEDQNSSRGMPSTDSVSKSLPDFLSDGPIQNDRLGENLQHENLVTNSHVSVSEGASQSVHNRVDRNTKQNELDMLRRELFEKNRRIHILEAELDDLRHRERRDANSLEYALLQVERNLKQTMKRASNAESALMKSRQENSRLKIELASLRSENSDLRLGGTNSNDTAAVEHNRSKKIAKELRIAANAAENSLRSLLTGIDNLRMIAASVENLPNYEEKTEEINDFRYEDSASGPAL